MLGDQLGEVRGEVSGFRVLKTDTGPRIETNFEGKGKFCGQDVTEIVTYWATPRMDGTFYGGADGLIVTQDTQNALYTGNGVGCMKGKNLAASWRGAAFYQSMAPAFAHLSQIAVLFEFDIEADGKTMTIRTWEWK